MRSAAAPAKKTTDLLVIMSIDFKIHGLRLHERSSFWWFRPFRL